MKRSLTIWIAYICNLSAVPPQVKQKTVSTMEICYFASPLQTCSKQLLFLGNCNRDITNHLRTYGLSKSQGDIDDEVNLILCRAGGSNQYILLCLLKGKIKSVKRKLTKYRRVHARNRTKCESQYWNLDCWIERNRNFITIIFNNFKNKITKIKGKLF